MCKYAQRNHSMIILKAVIIFLSVKCKPSHASAEMTVKLSVLISLWQHVDWLLHLALLCCQD